MALFNAHHKDDDFKVSILLTGSDSSSVHAAAKYYLGDAEITYMKTPGTELRFNPAGAEVEHSRVPRLVALGLSAGYIVGALMGATAVGCVAGALSAVCSWYLLKYFPL